MRPLNSVISEDFLLQHISNSGSYRVIGKTEQGNNLYGITIGQSHLPIVQIIAGSHPDEPAGPLAAIEYIKQFPSHPLYQQVQLAIVPQIDVDGVISQQKWLEQYDEYIDIPSFIEHRLRRLPKKDREFSWPGAVWPHTTQIEAIYVHHFFSHYTAPIAHLSLHGMAIAEGAWYLLDTHLLQDPILWKKLIQIAKNNNFSLHDSLRYGEKGFRRAGKGFCTIPNGNAMRKWALQNNQYQNDFALNSMDSTFIKNKHTRCAVSEFPLIEIQPNYSEMVKKAFIKEDYSSLKTYEEDKIIRLCPLSKQVSAMCHMITAVIESALRNNKIKQ